MKEKKFKEKKKKNKKRKRKKDMRASLNKFPDFFSMGTFLDSTHMKIKSPSK